MAPTRKARSDDGPDAAAGDEPLPPPETGSPATELGDLRVLKKYPNRRLYDTRVSGYITLADVKQMVLDHERFVVRDAKSGEDLTRSILLQIILEEESGGLPMFSEQMLAQVIRYYGHTMQGLMGSYLEKTLAGFTEMQQRFAEQLRASGSTPGTEAWTQMFGSLQPPANPLMQNLMTPYLESSKTLFQQMQEQMQKQAESLFTGRFPGTPGGGGR